MEPMTPTALKKLRVVDLKEKLTNLGLPLNGLKADLIKRLLDYYSSQARIREEATFNVVQQQQPPPPQSLPTIQPTIGQPGLIHGGSSYYINQTQTQLQLQHQLQLGGHIQHTSPSPSSISIQPCFVPTHMPHDELPTNFSSQVNPLSSPIELSTHHTHHPYQTHPSLQPHQAHQTHQSHQPHHAHQVHQVLQAHQPHQPHHAHHYHEPPSSHIHPTPSVIESSHIKMPIDDSTHYFDNSSHNQRRSNQSLNQPLQSPSSIDLSSHMSFIQEKPNTRECQAINQSQSSVSVDTLPIKHSDPPAVSMDQSQNPMIHDEPEDAQVHETPQKAIFDLENLLHEALKANQPIDLSGADPCKDDENVSENTSSLNEDSCSVTDLSQKVRDTSSVPESSKSPEAIVHSQPEREITPKLEQELEPEPGPEPEPELEPGPEPELEHGHEVEPKSGPEPEREPEPEKEPEPQPEPQLEPEPERQLESELVSVQQTESVSHQFQQDESKLDVPSVPVAQTDEIKPEPCTDIETKTVESTEPTPGEQTFLENEQQQLENEVKQEPSFVDHQSPPMFTDEEKNQLKETNEENLMETSANRLDNFENSVIDNKLEHDDNDMETNYEKETSSSYILEKETQQTLSDTVEVGAFTHQSEISEIKATDDSFDSDTRSESDETNIVPDQRDTNIDIQSNIIFNQNQSDFSSASQPKDYSFYDVKEQLSQEDNEEKDLNDMNDSVINDPHETPVIPPLKESKSISDTIDTNSKQKLSKNAKKKLRKKKKKAEKAKASSTKENGQHVDLDEDDDIEIEYVEDEVVRDPIYFQYVKVFEKFKRSEVKTEFNEDDNDIIDPAKKMLERKKPVELELKEEDEKNDGEPKLSKRKLKQLTRMTVADLKQKVSHPELVEMHDVTAKDPILLLHLKSTRNSVPVPRHWCFKRKYLQGKRGFEKPPFRLPEFIRKTGIMEMRQALQEKEDAKSLKTKQREKIRPKLGKIDIDYQKLHDAFFKWQTKPKMTIHGDIYYEGKEFETRLKEKKPGDLSVDLRVALGMPTGPNSHKCPPPWLIAMQRYGPPPSYPNLKIPGLNARIPDGCSFGYHAGGWGKPPVDEYGRPLYGDVFGLSSAQDSTNAEEDVDQSLWGEMESEEEEEEEEEDDDETKDQNDRPSGRETDESGIVTPSEGLATPSGFASIPNGMETPDIIELRKRKIEAEMESNENPALYTIIPEKKSDGIGKEMMGSTHVYDVSGSVLKKGQGIEVALDPNDLELPVAGLTAKYEQTLKEQQSHLAKEDLSDMVAEHVARQKRKKTQDTSKSNKKYKDFKF